MKAQQYGSTFGILDNQRMEVAYFIRKELKVE
jgi:hypothetical protein